VVEQYVVSATEGFAEDWDLEQLWTNINTLYPVSLSRADYEEREDLDRADLIADFQADAQAAYDRREEELGADVMRELERRVLLTVLDRKWREHLYEMDYLREGIGLRAMAQRDPLVEYQREGGDMFKNMMDAFMEEVVGFVFHLEVEVEQAPAVGVVTGGDGRAVQVGSRVNGATANGTGAHDGESHAPLIESGPDPDDFGVAVHAVDGEEVPAAAEDLVAAESEPIQSRPQVRAKGLDGQRGRRLTYTAPDEDGAVKTAGKSDVQTDEYAGVGRNAPCPCGSGKKFKLCHGRAGA
jgi:preprotein translocase subunit SecA